MARRREGSVVGDEIVQEIHADRLSDARKDVRVIKVVMKMMTTMISGP
jgi:hypothetical protein